MEAVSLPIYSSEGKEVETIKLNSSVFDGTVNKDAIYQAVNCYRAASRCGLASTKTRGEVRGGGKKPWRQKGTGRARVGSIRSPLWRHGGVVFGPHPRDFSYTIPKKVNLLALKSCLNVKVRENNLIILDKLELNSAKTKDAYKVLTNLKVISTKQDNELSVLLLVEGMGANLKRAFGNIEFLKLGLASDTNAYDLLANRKLLLTKAGLDQICKRLART